MLLALTALALGFLHGLGADHLMAITVLSAGESGGDGSGRVSFGVAARFAFGHALLLCGGAVFVLLLGWQIPLAFEQVSEVFAGGLLVLLGSVGLWAIIWSCSLEWTIRASSVAAAPWSTERFFDRETPCTLTHSAWGCVRRKRSTLTHAACTLGECQHSQLFATHLGVADLGVCCGYYALNVSLRRGPCSSMAWSQHDPHWEAGFFCNSSGVDPAGSILDCAYLTKTLRAEFGWDLERQERICDDLSPMPTRVAGACEFLPELRSGSKSHKSNASARTNAPSVDDASETRWSVWWPRKLL